MEERPIKMISSLVIFILLLAVSPCTGLLEGLYCGKENCYDVLGVTREATREEIGRTYRSLAKQVHPDRHRDPERKAEAEEKFKALATAYEILRNDEERADYDYMLDNPEAYYAHYYRYYRRRVAPKVDVRLVLAVVITLISAVQYFSGWSRYEEAIKYFATVPKYRNRALEMVEADAKGTIAKKKNGVRLSKAEQKEEMEKLIRKVIEEKMDIKGAYAKPNITDILWVQLVMFPYTAVAYVIWYVHWIWNFRILKKPYGDEQKLYLIRKNLGMGVHQFDALEEDTKLGYLEDELWQRDKFTVWKDEQDEMAKRALAENTRYKQYRRYLKTHGVGRMTFDDS